jgi:renalase|tara:strand:+ start:523 stop:1533 length:1011 start_codon:yes stop_codon:yes gene_type:complete
MHSLTAEVAIIGAGTAGCFIASLLDDAGIDCVIIEKSRGFGGRCSRRRIDSDHAIDLGAPEFSLGKVTDPLLKQKIQAWTTAGYLTTWAKTVSRFDTHIDPYETRTSLCGSPSMSTWHHKLAGHIKILPQTRVQHLEKTDNHWQLFDASHQLVAVTNKVVITSPPEQAIDLLNAVGSFNYASTLPTESLPQYVCAIGFTDQLTLHADDYEGGHGTLYRAVRESSKPNRSWPDSFQDVWLLHSTHEWAQAQCHADSGVAATQLAKSFCQHFGIEAEPHLLTSHYWRMARHKRVAQEYPAFIWDDTLKVGCCGDWLGSGGTAGALNSALALHQQIIRP